MNDGKIKLSERGQKKIEEIFSRYPSKEYAVLPVLWICQEEFGVISNEVIQYAADLLGLPPSKVYGLTSFYTMFKTKPKGKYTIYICSTLPCALKGSRKIFETIKGKLNIDVGQITPDGKFSIKKVECIACCDKAPAVMINEKTYYNLTEKTICKILDEIE